MASNTIPAGTTLLLAGTKRGLFMLTSPDRRCWTVHSQPIQGSRVFNAVLDQRTGRLFAADNGDFFGSFLRYSDDLGETWQEPAQGIQFPEESGLTLENIWTIEPGRPDEPGVVYAGTDPACLWVSHDNGETWEPNEGLLHHPTREHWQPGGGGLCLHTIVPDHSRRGRLWVGISAVGCLRSDDGGTTWTHANRGTRADYLPDRYPAYGQCIHRFVQHPTQPEVLYQQNHCGIYRSDSAGEEWTDIQGQLPSQFGFPIALDPHHPETVYTVVEDERGRTNFSPGFAVYRTPDGGESWQRLDQGLPCGIGVRLGVLRHGMCTDQHDPCGVYTGTNTGQIFASADRGDSWQCIADFLPPIYALRATILD